MTLMICITVVRKIENEIRNKWKIPVIKVSATGKSVIFLINEIFTCSDKSLRELSFKQNNGKSVTLMICITLLSQVKN